MFLTSRRLAERQPTDSSKFVLGTFRLSHLNGSGVQFLQSPKKIVNLQFRNTGLQLAGWV